MLIGNPYDRLSVSVALGASQVTDSFPRLLRNYYLLLHVHCLRELSVDLAKSTGRVFLLTVPRFLLRRRSSNHVLSLPAYAHMADRRVAGSRVLVVTKRSSRARNCHLSSYLRPY